jgi:hypothetical protein
LVRVAWKCAPRDDFIGWDARIRKSNLKFLTNNMRFLILPYLCRSNQRAKALNDRYATLKVPVKDIYLYPLTNKIKGKR